jgi:hypothetical protein
MLILTQNHLAATITTGFFLQLAITAIEVSSGMMVCELVAISLGEGGREDLCS